MYLKSMLYSVFLILLFLPCSAQEHKEKTEVKSVIKKLFRGMELSDTALIRSTMTPGVTMATVFRDKNDNPILYRDPSSLEKWLTSIGTPHPQVYYEEIWELKIEIDGDFAQAWCNYALYADKSFSHCGVDAFHLFKEKDAWKIFHIADTRRKTGCIIPQAIQDKHK